MTVEPSSLLTISIGTLLALLGVVVSASVTWTKLRVQLDHLAKEMRSMRSWHHAEVDSLTRKHHEARSQLADHEVRLAVIEADHARAAGHPVPRRVPRDLTPPPMDPVPVRRYPEDSGSHEGP